MYPIDTRARANEEHFKQYCESRAPLKRNPTATHYYHSLHLQVIRRREVLRETNYV